MDSKIEDSLKLWKGYSYIGLWTNAYLTLEDKCLFISHKKGGVNWFQIHLKIVECKDAKKRKFALQIGFKTLHFRADSRQTKQKWINAMFVK